MTDTIKKTPVIYNDKVAKKCKYGSDFIKDILGTYNYGNLYIPKPVTNMSQRKLEGFQKIAEERAYYQQNPVRFIKDFFSIQLLDSQAYLMQKLWTATFGLVVASRAYGKSFFIDLFVMAKQMLASNPYVAYIASGSSQQSALTFQKLEDIANDRLDSLIGSTGVIFKNEVEIQNAVGDGFSHSPAGFTYNLFNGSFTKTLNSNVDRNRGARASAVLFDECGWLSADLIQTYQAFALVDKGLKTGVGKDGEDIDNVRLFALPQDIPNQLVYVSSASNTDSEFFRMFREYSKKMIEGFDDEYFVAMLDCDLVMKPTVHGKPMPPALTQEKINAAMANNPEKARREYYCEFSSDAGANAIIRRGVIARNEETRKPVLYNDTGKRKIVITYDPARSRDNSVILVSEIYDVNEGKSGREPDFHSRILNCVSLVDVAKKERTPMRTPEQIKYLKKLILDYNMGGDEDYSNILGVYIDGGPGGAGVNIADYLMEDWQDEKGEWHKGLIDKEYSEEYVRKFPNAVNKLHVVLPTKMKSIIYESLIEMCEQDKISFTAQYDNKGYLMVIDQSNKAYQKERNKIIKQIKKQDRNISDEELQARVEVEMNKLDTVKAEKINLEWGDELALNNIDALKEELVNMVRIKRESGKDSFELTPEKRRKMHDDRAYTCALMAYALQEERRKRITKRKKPDSTNIVDQLFAQTKVSHRKIGLF